MTLAHRQPKPSKVIGWQWPLLNELQLLNGIRPCGVVEDSSWSVASPLVDYLGNFGSTSQARYMQPTSIQIQNA